MIKEKSGGLVEEIITKRWEDIFPKVDKATDSVAREILDEARLEEIANAAMRGATYTAVDSMINYTIKDILSTVKPLLNGAIAEFEKLLYEATTEAIRKIIAEAIRDRKSEESSNTTS